MIDARGAGQNQIAPQGRSSKDREKPEELGKDQNISQKHH